jgi:hypothetical protein
MKNVNLLYIIVVILTLLFEVNTQTFEIISVYQYCINGTAILASLEEYKEDYLYFGNDFYDSCTDGTEEAKYYKFHSDINIVNSTNLLNYALLEKNTSSYYVKIKEIKNLNWKPIKSLKINKSEIYEGDKYYKYYEIKKEGNKNIVLFRLSKSGNKKGTVSMDTLSDKPGIIGFEDETDEETDTDRINRINSSKYLSKINYMLLILFIYLLFN